MGDVISEYVMMDIEAMPTTIIVMGTSLKVPGLKRLVKDMAKAVQRKRAIAPDRSGPVIFVNKTPACKGEWKNVFDAEFIVDCDSFVNSVALQMAKLEVGLPKLITPSPSQTKITSFFKTKSSKLATTISKKNSISNDQDDNVFEIQASKAAAARA